ncbi:MAG: diaminopimelate epimerase [Proteobacteria bacterium]|nr:diaminopimelate epimerase [Pseudomonadota bacterium]
MSIPIEKWHGCKNDFIVTWMLATDRDTVFETLRRLASKLCARDGSGIGADGILVLEVKSRKDIYPSELHIINSDGSLASNCGNGLRCAAMSVRRNAQKNTSQDIEGVSFQVMGQTIDCRFLGRSSSPLVAVTMPIPKMNETNEWHSEALKLVTAVSTKPTPNSKPVTVDVGNPHIVLQFDEAQASTCEAYGKPMQIIRNHDGINVHVCHEIEITNEDQKFAKSILGESIEAAFKVWPWERGVGPTQACGTGACAVGVAALQDGLTDRSGWIACDMPGGRLYVQQSSANDPVVLCGPAVFVFSGEIEI